jgi:uncharacterized damage-inducible protein DinB
MTKKIFKPAPGEYDPYTIMYIDRVPDDGLIMTHLADNSAQMDLFLRSLPADTLEYRYAPGKWTIKEILLHIIDAERIFTYRALRFARTDATPLSGYDQDPYVAASNANSRSLDNLLREFTCVRQSTIALFSSLADEAWMRTGTANNAAVSVRALAYIIAGHELHHLNIIKEKYL